MMAKLAIMEEKLLGLLEHVSANVQLYTQESTVIRKRPVLGIN